MRKILVYLCVFGLVLAGASQVFAGGYINKSNHSVEYLRTFNRQASTDYADIVEYNPAGTVKLDDGFTLNVSVQDLAKRYGNETPAVALAGVPQSTDESNAPSVIPDLYAVYKSGPWAGFFSVNVPAGGGTVEYASGSGTTYLLGFKFFTAPRPGSSVRAKSYALGYTLGGAYQINDMVSLSLAGRYVTSEKEQQATIVGAFGNPLAGMVAGSTSATIDVEQKATGFGGIIGLDFFPNDRTTIGLTYQTRVALEYENDVRDSTDANGRVIAGAVLGVTDGSESREDIPAMFGTGISHKLTDRLRTEFSFRYYFNRDADLGVKNVEGTFLKKEKLIHDSIEFGIMFEYAFLDNLKGSAGYLRSVIGGNPDYMTPEAPELDANTFCGGLAWAMTPAVDLQLALGVSTYPTEVTSPSVGSITLKKTVPYAGFGVQYKF